MIDEKKEKKISRDFFVSRCRNSPFVGRKLRGFPEMTIYQGEVVYKA